MPIEVAEYDGRWPAMFESEASRLRQALGELALRIDHVGSTAVPGLAAKPVIDIQVSVTDLSPTESYIAPLIRLGYVFTTMPLPYLHRPSVWPHTHHVHVRAAGGNDERRTLDFRDWLRSHPEDREAYEKLKRRLARDADSSSAAGRARYSEAKTGFIREIERRSRVGG